MSWGDGGRPGGYVTLAPRGLTHRPPSPHRPARRVDQRIVADPYRTDGADRHGIPGDCLRAAAATLLDLPYEQVPHFAVYGRAWFDTMRRWARSTGGDFMCLLTRQGTVRWALADPACVGGLVLARGPSPRGPFGHVVVADIDLALAHDPHPSRAGLTGVDEVYAYCLPYLPPPPQKALTARTHQ